MAFRTLGDATGPGYDDDQVAAMAALYQVADTSDEAMPGDTRTAVASDKFPPNTSVGAPDLTPAPKIAVRVEVGRPAVPRRPWP